MSALQLSFALRTSANVKTVHLIGSWDGYQGQLPLSRSGSKAGAWTGTFRFQNTVLQQGQRYWYYYMMDGYHVSHDPAKSHTVEPTTGRKLNVLDVPAAKASSSASKTSSSSSSSKRASRRYTRDIPRGRAVSPSNIKSPHPQRPGQTKHIVQGYSTHTLEQLASRFSAQSLDDSSDDDSSDDESDLSCPSLTSGGSSISGCSSPESVSSTSSSCSCERYGITRAGHRVKLDCGGSRCGGDEDDCSSESEEEEYQHRIRATRRHGVVIPGY